MNNQTDSQLLRSYAETRSEAVFAELAHRHVDFVYSVARRMVRDSHLAEDVTQSVFVALAKNAGQLVNRPVLSGWLHRTAHNIAAHTVRTIERRRAREQEAAAMNELLADSGTGVPPVWCEIAPHLDAALTELNEPDRDALLLRYFERKSAREMAQTLGISDEAAQKRVSRAIERLREFLVKRGVTVGASSLVVVISTNAVQAAPVGLAITISTAAVFAGTTTTIATPITMSLINAKTVTAIVASALVAGSGAYLVQQREIDRLRAANQNLLVAKEGLINERDTALSAAHAHTDELARLRKNLSDLPRLRGEITALRRQADELASLQEENRQLRTAAPVSNSPPADLRPPDTPQQNYFPKESWTFAGYATPEAAFQSASWAALQGDVQTFLASLSPEMEAQVKGQLAASGMTEGDLAAALPKENDIEKSTGYRIVHSKMITDDVVVLTLFQEGRNKNKNVTLKRIGNEWKLAN